MTTIELKAPQSWAELTPEQLLYVAKCYNRNMEQAELLTACFLKFTDTRLCWRADRQEGDVRRFWFRHKGKRFSLTSVEFYDLCSRLRYLVDSIWLMVAPPIGGLQAPDSRFYNVSLDEYMTADRYYIAYSQSKDEFYLRGLMATLWRKQGADYGEPVSCKTNRTLRCQSAAVKTAVYLWYTGLKAWLKDKYPLVYGSADAVNDTPPDEQLFGLLRLLNGGQPKDNPRLLKTHVHEVLYELNKRMEENAAKR